MSKNEKEKFYYSKTPYAELHLHLGGAIAPRLMWHKIEEEEMTGEIYRDGYKTFEDFQEFFLKKRKSLKEYLEMHTLVEPYQKLDRLEYFINRLMRGAFEFENLSYLEIRHCPYSRTDKRLSESEQIRQMEEIVINIHNAMSKFSDGTDAEHYPIIVKQILCMHSQSKYTPYINSAILDLAIKMKERGIVSGVDIAGGEANYNSRYNEILDNFKRAKQNKLKTTAHIFETPETPEKMIELIDYLDRIGHGVQIPLLYPEYLKDIKAKEICLEICPTTYFKCGTFSDYTDEKLRQVFDVCESHDVDIVLGTDNSGMHNVRLQNEFENLLIHDIIKYKQFHKYRHNAFKHAFGLNEFQKEMFQDDPEIKIEFGKYSFEVKI